MPCQASAGKIGSGSFGSGLLVTSQWFEWFACGLFFYHQKVISEYVCVFFMFSSRFDVMTSTFPMVAIAFMVKSQFFIQIQSFHGQTTLFALFVAFAGPWYTQLPSPRELWPWGGLKSGEQIEILP